MLISWTNSVTIPLTAVALCVPIAAVGQGLVSGSAGGSSLVAAPLYTGTISINVTGKEGSASWSFATISRDGGGISAGLSAKGKAVNGVASLIKGGNVVSEAQIGGFLGLRVSRRGNPTDVRNCVVSEGTELPRGVLPANADRQVIFTTCQNYHDRDLRAGGAWLFMEVGFRGASYTLFDSTVAFADQFTTQSFDGGQASVSYNWWRAVDNWTVIGGVSIGTSLSNTVKQMQEVVVSDVLGSATDPASGTVRSSHRKDRTVYIGAYDTFVTVPVEFDAFLSPATLSTAGFWTYFRYLNHTGDAGPDDEFRIGVGLYTFKDENPFTPVGAVSVEWESSKQEFRLNLSAGIGVRIAS